MRGARKNFRRPSSLHAGGDFRARACPSPASPKLETPGNYFNIFEKTTVTKKEVPDPIVKDLISDKTV